MTADTPDNTDAAYYGIIARKRVWAINDGRLPTVEDYHAALVQCLKDEAIERLRLTDAERPLGDPEIAVEILKLRVAELEQAIRRLAEQDATLSVCDGNVTVTMDATLTDAEREAMHWFAHYGLPEHRAATLRGVLERLT